MNRWISRALSAPAFAAFAAVASAQGMGGMNHGYQGSFTVGETEGWHIGGPHLDINGGLLNVPEKDGVPKISKAYFSARVQAGTGINHLQIASNMLFYKDGPGPIVSSVLQITPLRNGSKFFLSGGAGGIMAGSNKINGWLEANVAWHSPIHNVTPYVQVGKSLQDGSRVQFLFGVSHPLAPYKLSVTGK